MSNLPSTSRGIAQIFFVKWAAIPESRSQRS
jgi:hypothetical protein